MSGQSCEKTPELWLWAKFGHNLPNQNCALILQRFRETLSERKPREDIAEIKIRAFDSLEDLNQLAQPSGNVLLYEGETYFYFNQAKDVLHCVCKAEKYKELRALYRERWAASADEQIAQLFQKWRQEAEAERKRQRDRQDEAVEELLNLGDLIQKRFRKIDEDNE